MALADSTNFSWASQVAYNAASQMINATFPSGAQTWVYDPLLQQLTEQKILSGGVKRMDVTYSYSAGRDNGQIAGIPMP